MPPVMAIEVPLGYETQVTCRTPKTKSICIVSVLFTAFHGVTLEWQIAFNP
jgi:hypothetical protein